jgi:hypothetical protein
VAARFGRKCHGPWGRTKLNVQRNSTVKVMMAPDTVKGAWPSSFGGGPRSGLLQSRTIPLYLESHVPNVPCSAPSYSTEVHLANLQLLCHTILEPNGEEVPATSKELGYLHNSRPRSRPPRRHILERPRIRDTRIDSSEDLCADGKWVAIGYDNTIERKY